MEVKPGYKQTEVGVIPEEWEVKGLPDVSWFQEGPGLRNWQFTNSGMKVINVTNLEDGVLNLDRTDRHISIAEFNRMYRHFAIDSQDIVMASSGNSYSKTAVVREQDLPLVMNTSVIRFKPSKLCDYGFLWALLTSPHFKGQIDLMITGGAQPNFGPYHLKKVLFPLPPLPEQRAIAEALSDVDGLLGGLDRLIAKKRDLKQAAMQQLLTGQTRLPGFHGEWEVKTLRDVLIRLANGALYQPSNPTGLPVTRIETIADGTIDMARVGYGARTAALEEYRMQRGDILFSHINSVDHIGKVAIYSGEPPLYHGMNLLLLRVGSSLDSHFLFYWLGSHKGRNKAVSLARQAVSQASINTSDLKRVEIPFPPLPEQTAIAEVLTEMNAELAGLEQRREKTRALKQAMMQELLTGRTRLV